MIDSETNKIYDMEDKLDIQEENITVGVIGAGVMGANVAFTLAAHNIDVTMIDISDKIIEKSMKEIELYAKSFSLLKPDSPQISIEDIKKRIKSSTDLCDLSHSDFVIENVTEDWEIKLEVYKKIDKVCDQNTLFFVNTSAIPITKISEKTTRPNRVVGLHFMNPVFLMPVVEVIRGQKTDEEAISITRSFLGKIGKEAIVVNDSPGFVTNRVMMLTINEAIQLLEQNIASASSIDRLFETCFNHKMGPLATADLIGLDTVKRSLDVLKEHLGDQKFEPCRLLENMVNKKNFGRKSGKGFYVYN